MPRSAFRRSLRDQPELRDELLAAIDTVFAKMTVNAPLAMILEVRGTVQLHSTRDPNGGRFPRRCSIPETA